MLPNLLQLASRFDRRGEAVYITEFAGAFGIADLVAFVPRGELLGSRLESSEIRPLRYEPDAAVVCVLSAGRGRAVDEVARLLGWPEEAVLRRLPKLIRSGAVARSSNGRLSRHPHLVPAGRLHAFEAKVCDWRRGIEQARRYRLWADTATVVLAQVSTRSRDSVLAEAERLGLGLGVQNRWIRSPRRYEHSNARRLLASELAVAALTAK